MLFKTAILCISGLLCKMKKIFLLFVLIFFTCGFSDIKQKDEYTCAPVCAANCLINILSVKKDEEKLVKNFIRLAKTDKNGTTAQNLIKALEIYLKKNHINTEIKYSGIRIVDKKYRTKNPINICEEIQNGSSIILNIGIYNSKNGTFTRNGGHYINANACRGNKILISDPYAKNSEPFYIELEKINFAKIINPKDNEKYSHKSFNYQVITPGFDYLQPDEKAILNGIIKIYPIYL